MLIKCMCTKSRYNDPNTKSLCVLIFSQRSTINSEKWRQREKENSPKSKKEDKKIVYELISAHIRNQP